MHPGTVIEIFVQQFKRGDEVPFSWFRERLNYDHETASAIEWQDYGGEHDYIQRTLLNTYGIVLDRNQAKQCYRVIDKSEYARYASRQLRNAIRTAFRNHEKVISAAPVEELSNAQIKELTDEKIRAGNLKQIMIPRVNT